MPAGVRPDPQAAAFGVVVVGAAEADGDSSAALGDGAAEVVAAVVLVGSALDVGVDVCVELVVDVPEAPASAAGVGGVNTESIM